MAIVLPPEVIALLNRTDTVKVLSTVDEQGVPHGVAKDSLFATVDGQLAHLEYFESSRTQRNLVRAIWFGGSASVLLVGADGQSWQIKGRPVRADVSGQLFREHYERLRQKFGDVDLAAVWIIEPREVRDQSVTVRREHEEAVHPFFTHLDRLVKP
jgi:hypothetical protein